MHSVFHEYVALQDNCVLQGYSAACNKTPRSVAGRGKRLGVGASIGQMRPLGKCGGRAPGSRGTQARHAGFITSCRIGHGRDSEKPRPWLPRERGRKIAAEDVDSKKMTLLRQHPNGRVLSMERTSVPGPDSTLLTVNMGDFCRCTF